MSATRTGAMLLALTIALPAVPARAWFTVVDNDQTRLELSARLMTWAVTAGQESIAGQEEDVTDFYVRRLRLLARGRVSKSITFGLQLGHDNAGAKLAIDDGSLRLKDAVLNWQLESYFQVAVGQMKVPYLRSNLESGFNQLLVDRILIPGIRPAREGQRDLGAMIWGNHDGLQYRLALFDGSDQEQRNPESSLRFAGRLAWNFFAYETDFGYSGTTLGEKRVLQLAVSGDLQDNRLDSRDDKDYQTQARDYANLAFELFYDHPFAGGSALTFEGAWVQREDDYRDPAALDRTIDGFYAQAGYLLRPKLGPGRLQLALRREELDFERQLSSARDSTTAGLNYYFKGHDRKLQLDYSWKREAPDELDNDELRLSVAAQF